MASTAATERRTGVEISQKVVEKNSEVQSEWLVWNESRGRSTKEELKETEVFCEELSFMKEAQCLKCKYSSYVCRKILFFLTMKEIIGRKHNYKTDSGLTRMWWRNCRIIDCPQLTQCRTCSQLTPWREKFSPSIDSHSTAELPDIFFFLSTLNGSFMYNYGDKCLLLWSETETVAKNEPNEWKNGIQGSERHCYY